MGHHIVYLKCLNYQKFNCCRCLVAQSCLTLWPHELKPTRLLRPWGFSRTECWCGLPFPSPRDLPDSIDHIGRYKFYSICFLLYSWLLQMGWSVRTFFVLWANWERCFSAAERAGLVRMSGSQSCIFSRPASLVTSPVFCCVYDVICKINNVWPSSCISEESTLKVLKKSL